MGLVKNLLKGDSVIWAIFFILCIISVVEVFSATSSLVYKTPTHWGPITRHILFVFAGIVVAIVAHLIPYKKFKTLGYILYLVSCIMLMYLMISSLVFSLTSQSLAGAENVNDAVRYITIFGVDFQPSELAKMSVIIIVSHTLAKHSADGFERRDTFWIIICVTGFAALLIFKENLSTAAILCFVVYIMMWLGGVPKDQMRKLTLVMVIGVALFALILMLSDELKILQRFATWKDRLVDFITPVGDDIAEYNYKDNRQVAHSNIAIASSNIWGCLPGNSVQRDFLYQAYSDFIFAIIIEELGLILGGVLLPLLYIVLMIRAGKIAKKCNSIFATYLALGIAILIGLQAMINMGVTVGVLPVTGQPLPLVSRGGTSFLINSLYIGILLSISRTVELESNSNKESETAVVPVGNSEENEIVEEPNKENA